MKIRMYRKTGLFFGLSTVLPWTLWFIAAYISHAEPGSEFLSGLSGVVALLGLTAPIAVTIFLSRGDRELTADMLGRFFNFRGIRVKHAALACFLMPASILLAQAVSLLFGYSAGQFRFAGSFSFTSGLFPAWFMLIIAPLLEELAWHTYGTDSLRARYNLFTTSLIFSLFWGFWHFPLSFIKDYYHSNLVEEGWIWSVNFLVSIIPFVMIMNWIYYKTNRNILLTIVFHITAGLFNEIFATHPMSKVIQTGLLVLFSIYIMVKDKKMFFGKSLSNGFSGRPGRIRGNFKRFILVAMILAGSVTGLRPQTITQTVRGRVYDNITQEPLPFCTVVILDSDPLTGTMADENGEFILRNVPVGRINLRVDMMGYESYVISELMVVSGREEALEVALRQKATGLDEVVVKVSRETSLNSMTSLSARQFTVEETQRYAGGLNDPARLVTSFAGVASPSVGSSGISVRGNSPDGLLWRIEGVEVPNPNHFADLTIAGGGMLTVISSQMMGNSDFFTGAFPAEYGNASSGVFDIRLNAGNSAERQYTLQAGLLGVDFATRGPFMPGSKATYNMNYRYSTMALVAPALPTDAGILKYQDLCFKTHFPAGSLGTFSFWGIGALDGVDMEALESAEWQTDSDRDNSRTSLNMFAAGLSHKINLNGSAFLSSTLSATGNGVSHSEQRLDFSLQPHPHSEALNQMYRFAVQSALTIRSGKRHSNKTGFSYQHMTFSLDINKSLAEGAAPIRIAKQEGNTGLLQIYTQSKISLLPQVTLNLGLNTQYFLLNGNLSVEPRGGIRYEISNNHRVAFAYGTHSRLEQLQVYFIEMGGSQPNRDLGFMRSEHFVFSYNARMTANLLLTIEPYYQKLKNVPVSPDSYISTLNNENALFFYHTLCSDGSGKNIGIDLTLERFLSKGFYYSVTTSLFDSKYTAADGIERNTRNNRNYVVNLVAGKEWIIGREGNRILGLNARYNHLGGNRVEPVNEALSSERQKVVYGETGGRLAFEDKFADCPVFSFTISCRKNKPYHSSVWALQILNATRTKEFAGHHYNFVTGGIDTKYEGIMIPNLSYKIEF